MQADPEFTRDILAVYLRFFRTFLRCTFFRNLKRQASRKNNLPDRYLFNMPSTGVPGERGRIGKHLLYIFRSQASSPSVQIDVINMVLKKACSGNSFLHT